jgi:purine-binding chemotaxis protein CheW
MSDAAMTMDLTGNSLFDDNAANMTQFVAFTLGEQTYCVDIMQVREIRAWMGTTNLPNAPKYVRGVINLRGVVVPIIDLRIRFDQGRTEPTASHVIIVVEVKGKMNGVLVDGVSDILSINEPKIMPVPDTGGDTQNPYLDGLINKDGELAAVVAIDRVIGGQSAAK